MLERKVSKLAFVAGPLAFVAAVCNTDASQPTPTPIEPPRYEDNIASQPAPEQAPLQNPEPVINQLNGNTVITEDGKTYELRPQVTIKQLLQDASLLSARAPQASMVETHIYTAQQKADINPQDPQISEDINKAAYLLFSYSDICKDPQAGIGGVARGFAQDAASYLAENDPEFWEDHKSPYLNGPCDWSKEESDTLVETEQAAPEPENTESNDPRTRNRGFFATFSPFLEQVIILEQDRKYELSYDTDLKTLLAEGNFAQVLAENINPETFSRVTATDTSDPNQLNILKEAAAAIENGPNGQLCKTDQRQLLTQRNLVRALASAAYTLDFENWDTNKQAFFNSCFWGQTGDFQAEYNTYAKSEFFTTKDGLRLYKKISWGMVNDQQLFDRLEADLSDPEVQRINQTGVSTIGVADKLRDAYARASAYSSNPDSLEFENIMTLDGYALKTWCRVSPAAREIMRRSASFIYLNTSEQNWLGYNRFNLGGCRDYLDQEQIGSTTKIFERFDH